jgi:excisionase family DNA binding protein
MNSATHATNRNTPLLTSEAAALLRYHPVYLRRLCATGKVRATKRGGEWMISQEEIDRLLGRTNASH